MKDKMKVTLKLQLKYKNIANKTGNYLHQRNKF